MGGAITSKGILNFELMSYVKTAKCHLLERQRLRPDDLPQVLEGVPDIRTFFRV